MKFIFLANAIILFWFTTIAQKIWAQPSNAIFTTAQGIGGGPSGIGAIGSQSVTDANSANYSGSSDNAFALIKASSTLGTYFAWLHSSFTNPVLATPESPVTVYIRTNEFSPALLGGGIGIQAYNNTSGTSNPVTTPASFPMYYLADGTIYVAITLSSTFQSIRITVTSPVALGTNLLRVYYSFYGPSATNTSNPYPYAVADCGLPNVTSKDASVGGLLTDFNIVNPGNAIDVDPTFATKSTFTTSGVSGMGYVKQVFYFNGMSNKSDAVRLVVSKSGTLLALNLASNVSIQAYNGGTLVGEAQLIQSLLDVQLLNIAGTLVTFYFVPKNLANESVIFDRIEVTLNVGALGVGVASNGLNIHDVRRLPDAPVTPGDVNVCTNVASVVLSALSAQDGLSGLGLNYSWFNVQVLGIALSASANYNLSVPSTPGTFNYYVEMGKNGCGVVSDRKKVTVKVSTPPTVPAVGLNP